MKVNTNIGMKMTIKKIVIGVFAGVMMYIFLSGIIIPEDVTLVVVSSEYIGINNPNITHSGTIINENDMKIIDNYSMNGTVQVQISNDMFERYIINKDKIKSEDREFVHNYNKVIKHLIDRGVEFSIAGVNITPLELYSTTICGKIL